MFSSDDDPFLQDGKQNQSHMVRRRKVDRACDACRRKKTRCDGPKMPDNICSNCLQSKRSCTYLELSKPRGPPKAYILDLEDKMEAMEAVLERFYPGADFSEDLGPLVIRDSWKNEGAGKSNKSPKTSFHTSSLDPHPRPKLDDFETPLSLLPMPSLAPVTSSHREHRHRRWETREPPLHASDSWSSDDDLLASTDSERITASSAHALTLRGTEEGILLADDPASARFHGRGSVPGIADATRKIKEKLLEGSSDPNVHPEIALRDRIRRPYFWRTPKWELAWEGYNLESINFLSYVLTQFPLPDLAASLIRDYFELVNPFYPLLHRPTFERQYFGERLHQRDVWFAAVCIAIFAVASKWSNDPRVVPQNARTSSGEVDWRKAGWEYFNLAIDCHRVRRSLILPATLFEIQTFTLLALFLRSTSAYPIGWILTGVGLRKAQDIGAHRKKMYRDKPSVDGELWKRAFWHLVLFDALGATVLGRACCVCQEDYDLDMPLEVDDEYWEPDNPTDAFKQPPGIPSRMALFNQLLKVSPILVFAQKTIYAMDRSASFVPKTRNEREKVLNKLEIALDDWYKALPQHLRLSENMEDPLTLGQSKMIHFVYYFVQIVIYRPFVILPSVEGAAASTKGDPRSVASRAMRVATAAARAIVRLVDIRFSSPSVSMTSMLYSSYYGAGQLLLGIWDLEAQEKALKETKGKNGSESRFSLAVERDELVADLRKLVEIYESVKGRWDFTEHILGWLREFLPRDGETKMPEPGILNPPFLGSDEPSRIQDISGLTGFFSANGFVDDPEMFSFPGMRNGSVNGSMSSGSFPAQMSDFNCPPEPYRRMSVSDQSRAQQSLPNHGFMQSHEAGPLRHPFFVPSSIRRAQPYADSGLQRSISAIGLSELSGTDVPQSSTHHEESHPCTQLYPGYVSSAVMEPQYGLEMAPIILSPSQQIEPPNESSRFTTTGYQSFR